jgi:DNA-binding GntR family transcriptional regulator
MVQTEWAERLGTSRMPVRDAFLRLESEGLLTATDTGVSHVAKLSEEDIADAYVLNAVAAGMAAQRAAERMSDAAVADLVAKHEEFKRAMGRNDLDTLMTANNAFHRILTMGSASPRLIAMIRVLSAGLPHVGTREIPQWRVRAVETHAAIVEAVLARDGERVGQLMRDHVLEAAQIVSGYLRERGFWDPSPDEDGADGIGVVRQWRARGAQPAATRDGTAGS